MDHRSIETALYAGTLFGVLGVLAWLTGRPFVFPSLGPSAFVLAVERRSDRTRPSRVVGSHLIGGVAGFVAYAALAPDLAITAMPAPGATAGFALAASGTASMVLTALGMFATGTVHPPACATTLIVSLGVLSTPTEVGIIVASVSVLVAVHAGVRWGYRLLTGTSPTAGRD